ncbi:MAG: N-acetylglucosamine-6-phosphate deacetylase [Janthinobacterium lividum]
MQTVLTAAHLLTDDGLIERPLIVIEDGYIQAITSRDAAEVNNITHDFGDAILTPGLLDIHMHGCAGKDVMEATPEALRIVSTYLAQHGVAEYLATTVTAPLDATLRSLDGLGRLISSGEHTGIAEPIGIHIEGPFVSHAKRGMHPPEHILEPTPALLDRFWEASHGQIRLMTIAPEVPGAVETIRRATDLGIRSSIGHSDANKSETLQAIAAGATTATHTFNAMRPYGHRDPGILGVVLDDDQLYSDLICDGIHVSPEAVRLWFKAKGPSKAILITDSLEATGMPNGDYTLGVTRVHAKNGTCTTDEGVLAGSIITLKQALERFRSFTGADLATAVHLASRNPSLMLGRGAQLAQGRPAYLNAYTRDGLLLTSSFRGKIDHNKVLSVDH